MVLNRDTLMAMSVEFKRLEDRIAVVLAKCDLEAKLQEQKSEALRNRANRKVNWAIGLPFIQGVKV